MRLCQYSLIKTYSLLQVLRSRPTQKTLMEMGLTGDVVAFWGFANTDIYQCVPVDRLHQCFNGISMHLIEALKMCIEDTCRPQKETIFVQIRDRLASFKRLYHGERIPKDSLWAEKTCAEVRVRVEHYEELAHYI